MAELAIIVLVLLGLSAIAFDPLACGPACGEALTAEEESRLNDDDDEDEI